MLQLADEQRPLGIDDELPEALRTAIHRRFQRRAHGPAGRVRRDADTARELRAQGVIFCSLEQAAREHEDLVLRHLAGR